VYALVFNIYIYIYIYIYIQCKTELLRKLSEFKKNFCRKCSVYAPKGEIFFREISSKWRKRLRS
jgi:hypothetical protein